MDERGIRGEPEVVLADVDRGTLRRGIAARAGRRDADEQHREQNPAELAASVRLAPSLIH
jgi:hypothetical protein